MNLLGAVLAWLRSVQVVGSYEQNVCDSGLGLARKSGKSAASDHRGRVYHACALSLPPGFYRPQSKPSASVRAANANFARILLKTVKADTGRQRV